MGTQLTKIVLQLSSNTLFICSTGDDPQQILQLYLSRAMKMSYANNKGADQPVYPRSLISAFVVRCLDSIISLGSIATTSRL